MFLTPRRMCTLALAGIFSLPALAPLSSRPLFAQVVSGYSTITGAVLDPGGNVLPSASILLKSDSSSLTRKANADSTGHFSIDGLPAGIYTVSVSAPGFSITV
ncbi:MAG: carboxypeptidase-like regulatory domain-containing protein, partial [Edaphobacter sp.]